MIVPSRPANVPALRPARRVGFQPIPIDRHPPWVLLSSRWQRAAPVLGGALLGSAVASALTARWRGLARWLAGMTLGGAGLAALGVWHALQPRLERITVTLPTLPTAFDGFRILHLSDFHLDQPLAAVAVQRALRLAQPLHPDLIVFTGDFVSHVVPADLINVLQPLTAPHGVYAIWGNHDYWVDDMQPLRDAVAQAGLRLLENQHVALHRDDATLYLAGVDDQWEGHDDLAAALRGIPADGCIVLLAHEPDLADDAARHGVALQLSGHTHGGQVALPGLGPAFLPRHGWRYARGLVRVGSAWVYVSRGVGGLPFRLGSRSEITEITLRCVR